MMMTVKVFLSFACVCCFVIQQTGKSDELLASPAGLLAISGLDPYPRIAIMLRLGARLLVL